MPISTILSVALTIALGLMFLTSGGFKLAAPQGFQSTLATYDWLPVVARSPLSRAIPLVEIALGMLLVIGYARIYMLLAAAALLMIFTVAIGLQIAHGRAPDCGCFGTRLAALSRGRRILIRNGVLLLGNALALLVLSGYLG